MSLLLLLVCLNIFWRSTLSLTCKIRKGKVHLVKERELELLSLPQLCICWHLLREQERQAAYSLEKLMKTGSVVTPHKSSI